MGVLTATKTLENNLAIHTFEYAQKLLLAASLICLYSRENPTITLEETYIMMFIETLLALVEKRNDLIILL